MDHENRSIAVHMHYRYKNVLTDEFRRSMLRGLYKSLADADGPKYVSLLARKLETTSSRSRFQFLKTCNSGLGKPRMGSCLYQRPSRLL
jgi:hypothetical protein